MSKTTDRQIKKGQVWKHRHSGILVNVLMKSYPFCDGFQHCVPNIIFADLMAGDIFHEGENDFRNEFEKTDTWVQPPSFTDGNSGAPAQTEAGPGPTAQEMADAIRIEVPFGMQKMTPPTGQIFELNPMMPV